MVLHKNKPVMKKKQFRQPILFKLDKFYIAFSFSNKGRDVYRDMIALLLN